MEVWKDIPGWEGLYQASSRGRIRSVDRSVLRACRWGGVKLRTYKGMLLKSLTNPDGYQYVGLSRGKSQCRFVHVLVAAAFIGPKPAGCVVSHRDGNPANNCIKNLRYATFSQNYLDSVQHGTAPLGIRNHNAKLDEDSVKWIREHGRGETLGRLAAKFGVCKYTIYRARKGLAWAHVG